VFHFIIGQQFWRAFSQNHQSKTMEHGGRYIISSWIEDCGSPATLDNGTTNEVVAAYTFFLFSSPKSYNQKLRHKYKNVYIYIPKILKHNPRPWRWVWNTPRHWLGKPYRWLVLSEHMLPNKRFLTKTVWFLQPFSVPPFSTPRCCGLATIQLH
jgi:hypothetical protein